MDNLKVYAYSYPTVSRWLQKHLLEKFSQDLAPMPMVYPDMTAAQLDAFLKQSTWAKFSDTVEVFEEPGRGRGIRIIKHVPTGNVVCWYSEDVFSNVQADMVYQINDGDLYASVSNYTGEIQYGVLINDNFEAKSGGCNCYTTFDKFQGRIVAKVRASVHLSLGDVLSLDYGEGYWAYSLSHFQHDEDTKEAIYKFLDFKV
jgi:hypothetical protein